jgi:PRTRC genetic system protein B
MLEITYPQQRVEYKLSHALLFYEGNGEALATLHKVRNRQLLAGKSLSVQDVEELFHSDHQRQKMVFLPPEVIAWSRNEVVWFEKSRTRPIYFNAPEPKRRFLNKISGKNVIWPNLVFKISRNHISCWAVKSRAKPNQETKLYNAPFTNIFTDHRFCPPNEFHEIHEENMIDFARKAVDVFFRGHFSHLYGDMLNSITYPRGRDRFWEKMVKDLEQGKCTSFPNRYLVSSNMKLRSILS